MKRDNLKKKTQVKTTAFTSDPDGAFNLVGQTESGRILVWDSVGQIWTSCHILKVNPFAGKAVVK